MLYLINVIIALVAVHKSATTCLPIYLNYHFKYFEKCPKLKK